MDADADPVEDVGLGQGRRWDASDDHQAGCRQVLAPHRPRHPEDGGVVTEIDGPQLPRVPRHEDHDGGYQLEGPEDLAGGVELVGAQLADVGREVAQRGGAQHGLAVRREADFPCTANEGNARAPEQELGNTDYEGKNVPDKAAHATHEEKRRGFPPLVAVEEVSAALEVLDALLKRHAFCAPLRHLIVGLGQTPPSRQQLHGDIRHPGSHRDQANQCGWRWCQPALHNTAKLMCRRRARTERW